MKKIAVMVTSVTIALAATPVISQTLEQQLKDLKRLRDSGLISEPVYAEQQRRILEARAPKPEATRRPAQVETKRAARVAGLPGVGTTWNYGPPAPG